MARIEDLNDDILLTTLPFMQPGEIVAFLAALPGKVKSSLLKTLSESKIKEHQNLYISIYREKFGFRDNVTALLSAVENGHKDVYKLIARRDKASCRQALRRSVWERKFKVSKKLIKLGADDPDGSTLELAVEYGDLELAQLLIEAGADMDRSIGIASRMGATELVSMMLDYGANAEPPGFPPLWNAVAHGHTDIVRLLLENGAESVTTEPGDFSPITHAASAGYTEIVQLLIDAGADIHRDALSSAAYGGHVDIVRALLHAGADPNEALRVSAEKGRDEIVRILIDAGADVHFSGDSALRYASFSGHDSTVRILLEAGADIHAGGDKALVNAARQGNADVVRTLIRAGAYVRAEALEAAAVCRVETFPTGEDMRYDGGHLEVVKILLEAGVVVSDRALINSYSSGCSEIKRLLEGARERP
jgi:ankyrin repeat protein